MKNRDFIITSLQPWDIEIGSTIKIRPWRSRKITGFYTSIPRWIIPPDYGEIKIKPGLAGWM